MHPGLRAPTSRSSIARRPMRSTRPPVRRATRASCRSRKAPSSLRQRHSAKEESTARCATGRRSSTSSASRAASKRRRARRRPPISFRRLPAERYVAVCAQCHAQSAVHDAQAGGAVNHSETGEPFRTYSLRAPFGVFTQSVLSRWPVPRDDVHQRGVRALSVFSPGAGNVRVVPRPASVECGAESKLAEVRGRFRRNVRAVPRRDRRRTRTAHASCSENRGEPLRVVPHAAHHGGRPLPGTFARNRRHTRRRDDGTVRTCRQPQRMRGLSCGPRRSMAAQQPGGLQTREVTRTVRMRSASGRAS